MDNREKQLTKEIYRMIGSLKTKSLSKVQRKQLEEDVAYKQKKLQAHLGITKFVRPMTGWERKAAKQKAKANNHV